MELEVIGWVWLGILIGAFMGFCLSGLFSSGRIRDLEAEIVHHIFVRDSLKDEIFRLDNQTKPMPRNKRTKSKKVGK